MISRQVDHLLGQFPQLKTIGGAIAHNLHHAVLNGGDRVRSLADLLHGTWLGHPLHPVLTDVVVGGWTLGLIFDLISLSERSRRAETVADALTTAGNVAALPTMLSGLADYSTIPRNAVEAGLVHAAANNVAFVLQLASANARKDGDRNRAIALSSAAMFVATVGAWLGGHLVFDKKVGVNHTQTAQGPTEWTAVLDLDELDDARPRRLSVEEQPVLLYRRGETVQAIGAVCPHAGGPLEEGEFYDNCVQCPWHDSVFDLSDGRPVHGPSTYPVPNYEARIRNGQIEVRLAASEQ